MRSESYDDTFASIIADATHARSRGGSAGRGALELRLSARRAIGELKQAMNTMHLMSKEIDHRLMNSLQVVASLLSLQSHEAGDAAAAEQLKLAANRVMTVAQVHRHFYIDPDVKTTRLLEFFQRLCADLDQILQCP